MTDTRLAIPADIPALLDGIAQLATHHGDSATATHDSLMRDLFAPCPWLYALIAQTPQGITGYGLLLPLAQVQYGKRGMDLHHLFTWPSHRQCGTGKALLAAAQRFSRDQGCSYLTVGTHPANPEAEAYYLHHGFTRRPNTPRFVIAL